MAGTAAPPEDSPWRIRVAGLDEKEALLAIDKERLFTEPHYNGFPAVLVRLSLMDVDDLAPLITGAWRCLAPRALVDDFESRQRPATQKKPRSKR